MSSRKPVLLVALSCLVLAPIARAKLGARDAGTPLDLDNPPSLAPTPRVAAAFTIGGTELVDLTLEKVFRRFGRAPVSHAPELKYVCYRLARGPYVLFWNSNVGAGLQLARSMRDIDWRFGDRHDPPAPHAKCVPSSSSQLRDLVRGLPATLASTPDALKTRFGEPSVKQGLQIIYLWGDRVPGPQGGVFERDRWLEVVTSGHRVRSVQLAETITS